MSAPTIEELQLIEQFRRRLKDLDLDEEQKSDMQLLRWIRARDNKLDQAETMFRKSFKWREEHDIANILTWKPPEMLTDIYPIHESGFDNENTPVVIFPMGRADLKGIMRNGYMHETVRYMDQVWERAISRMKGRLTKEGVPVTQFTCVLDMDQLGLTTAGSLKVIEYLTLAINHFDSNYPEIFRKCFIINTSRAFQILYACVKPVLSAKTIKKFEMYTTEDKWRPALIAEIPSHHLPEYYGGTAWSVLHSFVGYNPQDSQNVFKSSVGAGEVFKIPINMSNQKSSLKWNVGIESYDIDFFVTFNDREVIPRTKLESHKASVLGSLECNSPGIYTFHFDNSYSRLRSKTVKYFIKLEP
ncbi:unnamed protein product [Allacma fusca]|uniref:SEC14-like protein 2 n=1 Tax=Allacma fusca TaxID=39272 RepID=A0A8J2Q1A4_9HEXA|nr:unnamed protein product [Allacma fusca]